MASGGNDAGGCRDDEKDRLGSAAAGMTRLDGWESRLPVSTSTRVKASLSQSRRGDAFQGFD